MAQLPPGFVLDGQQSGPLPSPPEKPKDPPAPKTTWTATTLPDGTPAQISSEGKVDSLPKPENATEAQQKTSVLLSRVMKGFNDITGVASKNPEAQEPGVVESVRGGLMPGGITGIPARAIAGEDRRIVHDAQRDVLDALLTLSTGAAYTAEQLSGQMASYFPQYGDTQNEIATKNQRMKSLIESVKINAGPRWGEVEKAIAPYMQSLDTNVPEGSTVRDGNIYGPDGAFLGKAPGAPDGPMPGGGGTPPPSMGDDSLQQGGGAWQAIGQGAGSLVEGFGDTLGIALNPINTVIGRAAGYDGYTADFGTTLRETMQLPDNPNATTDAIIKGGSAALTGAGLARGGANLASGAFRNALTAFAQTPVRDAVAGGAASGLGEVGRQVGGIPGQVIGTLIGGFGGYGGANALMKAAAPKAPSAMAQAATRQGVDMLPADAGGPVARAVTTGTKASPLSVAPVVKAAQRSQEQMRAATGRAADSQGGVVTTDVAGQNVRRSAERFTEQTSARGRTLYTRAGEAAKGVKIKPIQTMEKLQAYIARVKNNPAAPESAAAELERFASGIADGVNVEGLRDARTTLSQGTYDGKLRSGADKAMWKDILTDLSTDIENGLASVGKTEAAAMFKRADTFWKDRVEHIDEVLEPILGRGRGGEEIVGALESMARGKSGGNARLSRLLANMTPQEAGQVRATIIDRMGQATPGAQDAEGTAYSAATFLTNWNKMTPQAKASLFANKELRSNLNDIATLAEGMKASQQMANHSNTGVAALSNVGAAVALAATHPVAVVLGAGAQYLTGKLMASPGFARLLARTAKLPPEAAGKTFTQNLATLAANDNAIAGDARALGEFIASQAGKSPGAVAAGEDTSDSRRIPPQQ